MILKQYYLGCLAHASYLLGDETSSTAIIVDPQRDIHQYLIDAEQFGLEIRHVFLTHFHADFVAGHLELRDRCGATIRLGARAKAEYAFVSMYDGDSLEFPGLRVQVLETPGHTIESISILAFDLERDPAKPYAVLTGAIPCSSGTSAAQTCELRWVGQRTISARIFTTHFATSC
jgi:glyoxylase-like metal-dependent hydrolase (beta-lactamase superfamily II)